MNLEADYMIAREQPPLRQKFLDTLYEEGLGEYRQYMKGISYSRKPCSIQENGTMKCNDSILHYFGMKKIKSNIVVYPLAFNLMTNCADFVHVLKYHEGWHAKMSYKQLDTAVQITCGIVTDFIGFMLYEVCKTISKPHGITPKYMMNRRHAERELVAVINEMDNLSDDNSEEYKNGLQTKIAHYTRILEDIAG